MYNKEYFEQMFGVDSRFVVEWVVIVSIGKEKIFGTTLLSDYPLNIMRYQETDHYEVGQKIPCLMRKQNGQYPEYVVPIEKIKKFRREGCEEENGSIVFEDDERDLFYLWFDDPEMKKVSSVWTDYKIDKDLPLFPIVCVSPTECFVIDDRRIVAALTDW